MLVCGIIAEYDPFHNGHAYHVREIRNAGYTHIVAVMGGNFSQRGGPSALSKPAKAAAALSGGVDLVIELPLARCLSGAESFAFAGVYLLKSLGAINAISFGSECGSLPLLMCAADACNDPQVNDYIRSHITEPRGYADIRQRAVSELFDTETACVLSSPNDILATEYISAAKRLDFGCDFLPVRRSGSSHDSPGSQDGIASASYIRSLSNIDETEGLVPVTTAEILRTEDLCGRYPVTAESLDKAVVSRLRGLKPDDISALADVSEGLGNRLYAAIRSGTNLDDIISRSGSKRYPTARVRRLLYCAALSVTREDSRALPSYIRVLGATERGLELLKTAEVSLTVVTRASEISALGKTAARQFELECSATDLYTLGMKIALPCGSEQRFRFIRR